MTNFAKTSAPCELLAWDTEFFQFRIARANGDTLDDAQAEQIQKWSRAEAVRCLYFLARADCPATLQAAERHGFQLVDLRVTLERRLSKSPDQACLTPAPGFTIRELQSGDSPVLEAIAEKCHGDTRFFSDSHFPRAQAEKLYATWIRLECEGRADQVFVAAAGDGRPMGYISCHLDVSMGEGQIGLVGVGPQARGQGVGKALVFTALNWLANHGAQHATVVTQGKNVAAQRLYQSCGFLTRDVRIWYHKWFTQPAAPVQQVPQIPFNKSSLLGREFEHICQTMTVGQIAGDQTYSKKCHALLEQALGVKRALLTTSCTHALEMSALLLEIQPGDEVIVPSFTFVSTANAFALRGARIVFADIRPDTLNLDETRLEGLITEKTRAIVVVHYAGVGCEMDTILDIATRHSIPLVEDNAHGLFGKYRGRWLGTFGCLATQSFHETKNITCGEGGALLINDPALIERAEILREKGTDRSKFFRGQVDKYSWVDVGSSYVMSDVLAAFLYGQLEISDTIQARRRRIWEYYDHHLREWAHWRGIGCPVVPAHCEQAYHMYYLFMPSLEERQSLISFLKQRGILSVFHYVPLHLSPMGRRMGGGSAECAVTEETSDRLVRLPFYNSLSEAQQDQVIKAVRDFPGLRRERNHRAVSVRPMSAKSTPACQSA